MTLNINNNYIIILLKAGILLSFSSCFQTATAASVQIVGSFNDPTASNYFFFNRTYNQDNDGAPAKQLPNNLVTSTDSVSYFGWGIDTRESFQNHQIIQSHFWFNGAGSVDGSSATTIAYGEAFSLGSFTYTNEETVLSGGMVEIDFQMDIMFDGLDLLPVEYRIGIDNTSNPLADTASLLTYPESMLFTMGNTEYLLTFNGFSRDDGNTFETSATLPEDQQTTAEIFATITTTTVVPVPAAVWLFGSGLLGLVGFAKRRKNNA